MIRNVYSRLYLNSIFGIWFGVQQCSCGHGYAKESNRIQAHINVYVNSENRINSIIQKTKSYQTKPNRKCQHNHESLALYEKCSAIIIIRLRCFWDDIIDFSLFHFDYIFNDYFLFRETSFVPFENTIWLYSMQTQKIYNIHTTYISSLISPSHTNLR